MKQILSILLFLLPGIYSYPQEQQSDIQALTREEMKSWKANSYRFHYKDLNWRMGGFSPGLSQLGYKLSGMDIDTAKVYPIFRDVISPKHYHLLNKKEWRVFTVLSGKGKIVAVAFWFKDDSGVNNEEFAVLAKRIKEEVHWKLYFNKDVTDLFYLELSFPGPKL
ncbi:MAG: hypothetical protein AB2L24_15580 [Mangrovibacterium sp.]